MEFFLSYNYREVQTPSIQSCRPVHSGVWQAPPPGVIKINFDAANPPGDQFQIGAAARDMNGRCLGGFLAKFWAGPNRLWVKQGPRCMHLAGHLHEAGDQ